MARRRAVLAGLATLLAAAPLAGCGWRLRGSVGDGVAGLRVRVRTPEGLGAIGLEARRELRALGATVVEPPEPAERVLVLTGESISRRVLSVDSAGRAEEYELRYRVTFRVETPDGEALGAEQTVTLTDSYLATPTNTLAEQAVRDRLAADLREEAIRLVIARMARVAG